MLFNRYFQCLNFNMKNIWNFENPRMAATSDVITLLYAMETN